MSSDFTIAKNRVQISKIWWDVLSGNDILNIANENIKNEHGEAVSSVPAEPE